MLRQSNPYNGILSDSVIFVDLLSSDAPDRREEISDLSFTENGGTIRTHMTGPTVNSIFSISHSKVDGYGLLVLLSKEFKGLSFSGTVRKRENRIVGYKYIQLVCPITSKQASKNTFTQQFSGALVECFDLLKKENIGMVVNLGTEDVFSHPWGNGIVITTLRADRLFELSKTPKEIWRKDLTNLAHQTLKILQKRPGVASAISPVVISSLGHIGKRDASNSITAQNAIIAATPIFKSSMNLFLYCDDDFQSLVLCGEESHWMFSELTSIDSLWRNLC